MKKRPYVICHMSPSIDGKIVSKNWSSLQIAYAAYERTATTLDADAWIVGRVSMAPYAGKSRVRRLTRKQQMPRRDFIAEARAQSYAIAIDPSGKLTWRSNTIDDAHVITVLGERVSDDYLAFLQSRGCRTYSEAEPASISGESWRNSGRRLGSAGCCSKAAARSMGHSS